MNYYHILLIYIFLITVISGRAVYYDQLNEDDNPKLFSSEDKEIEDFDTRLPNILNDNYDSENDLSYDSYEERKFHQRSLFSSSRPPHTISPHTRQAIIDILQKAFDQGWRPNLKHYVPATRFGRHRR